MNVLLYYDILGFEIHSYLLFPEDSLTVIFLHDSVVLNYSFNVTRQLFVYTYGSLILQLSFKLDSKPLQLASFVPYSLLDDCQMSLLWGVFKNFKFA